jgi:hypothetical protein
MGGQKSKTKDIEVAETILETCPVCGSAVGSEETCTWCGAGLAYYRQLTAAAQSPAETVQPDAAKQDSASEVTARTTS